jgi:hypothetical protein
MSAHAQFSLHCTLVVADPVADGPFAFFQQAVPRSGRLSHFPANLYPDLETAEA